MEEPVLNPAFGAGEPLLFAGDYEVVGPDPRLGHPEGSYFSKSGQGILSVTGVGRRLTSQAQIRQAKVCGTYANAFVASAAAREKGADEALLLDESGFLAEASAADVFLIRDKVVLTPVPRVVSDHRWANLGGRTDCRGDGVTPGCEDVQQHHRRQLPQPWIQR